MKFFIKIFFLFSTGIFIVFSSRAQEKSQGDSSSKVKLISAGPQYKRTRWHNLFWGTNYRKEWSTLVPLPEFYLNEKNGGLIPDKLGGGHQTSSLHLLAKNGQNYTLRSVDKRLGKVLPQAFKGTWIERQVNDEVSMSNPYGALTIPIMAQSAGIYHTNPEIFYLPKQAALDSFNDKVGNNVYLFEQRLKGDWHNAPNLGNFDKFYKTEEVMQKIEDKPENRADQKTFLKDRLFDIFIGDWDRHEDQWAWGEVKSGDYKIYVPVPEDRDQAFSKHGGLILKTALSEAQIKYMQSFSGKIKNVNTFNYEERGIDRFFLNELTKQQWDSIAENLRLALTDSVIEAAVHQVPAEIFAISGKKIIADLKSRREQIPAYADQYYLFLSKEVEIVGTKGRDYFNVNRLNNDETSVQVYNIAKDGMKADSPYYSRVFQNSETKEIRLFGLAGNDVYNTEGKVSSGMQIRIIGGADKDSILLQSLVRNRTKTFIYDDHNNYLHTDGSVRKKYSGDNEVHRYDSMSYVYDVKQLLPIFFYSDLDRFYVGLGYIWQHQAWRKKPYVFKQVFSVNYSISQNALSFIYAGIFPNTIGKWNLSVLADYDAVVWTNFYGLGNESILTTKNINYNRMRSREAIGGIGLNRKFGNNNFEIGGFYHTVKIINDAGRYTAFKVQPDDPTVFDQKNFAGAIALYTFSKLNDAISPTAGITFSANGSYTQNTSNSNQSFWKYGGNLQLYIPLFYKFSIATSGAIETVNGNPEFYQYPEIGGGDDLRGFQRQRFYGKTAFYNSNELRFISNVKNYLYNGKAGVLLFVDDGRVWLPGETSNTLHVGYGAGIFLAPFNFVSADITYGFSKEDNLLQFRFSLKL
jgi:hypothetical protein